MKAYCHNCELLQPSSFRPGCDAETGEQYEDLCCGACHFVVATVQERDTHTKAQEPARQPLTDEQAKKLCKCGPVYAPDGKVERDPESYRREIEAARLFGLREGEKAHKIGGQQ